LGAFQIDGHAHFCERNFTTGFGNLQLHGKFEVASFSSCSNIKGEPANFGELPRTGSRSLFFQLDFKMGLGKPQLHAKFEVDSFSHCINIEGEPPNFGELA